MLTLVIAPVILRVTLGHNCGVHWSQLKANFVGEGLAAGNLTNKFGGYLSSRMSYVKIWGILQYP
jgi:hypothetical protein